LSEPSVVAVVLTFNRRDRLAGVLSSLAQQSRPLDHVLVVDNGSTDGTFERAQNLLGVAGVTTTVVRMVRNGGSAEGYHVALEWCIERGFDWAWLVEDDLVPAPGALHQLLDRPESARDDTVALVAAIDAPGGGHLLVPRGVVRSRLAGTPCRPIPASSYEAGAVPIEYFGFLGSMVRLDAVAEVGLPKRDMLGWIDDVEFSSRLARSGTAWLVPAARVLHDDGMPAADFGDSVRDRLRRLRKEPTVEGMWKHAYGLRNLIWWGRQLNVVQRRHVLVYCVLLASRAFVFGRDHRLLRVRIYVRAALDGWRGRFRNASPRDWASITNWQGSIGAFLDTNAMPYPEPARSQLVQIATSEA
jgi:GT2 family glycosyltransferase